MVSERLVLEPASIPRTSAPLDVQRSLTKMFLPRPVRNSWPAAERAPPGLWLMDMCDGGGLSKSGTVTGGAVRVAAEAARLLHIGNFSLRCVSPPPQLVPAARTW